MRRTRRGRSCGSGTASPALIAAVAAGEADRERVRVGVVADGMDLRGRNFLQRNLQCGVHGGSRRERVPVASGAAQPRGGVGGGFPRDAVRARDAVIQVVCFRRRERQRRFPLQQLGQFAGLGRSGWHFSWNRTTMDPPSMPLSNDRPFSVTSTSKSWVWGTSPCGIAPGRNRGNSSSQSSSPTRGTTTRPAVAVAIEHVPLLARLRLAEDRLPCQVEALSTTSSRRR